MTQYQIIDMAGEIGTGLGSGPITLTGASPGFQTFAAAYGAGPTTIAYTIKCPNGDFENGYGVVTAGTLTRASVISSSAGAGNFITLDGGECCISGMPSLETMEQELRHNKGAIEPAFKMNGTFWVDTTHAPIHCLKVWCEDTVSWQEMHCWDIAAISSGIPTPCIDASTATDGQILRWDAANACFLPADLPFFNDTGATAGDVFQYDSVNNEWVATNIPVITTGVTLPATGDEGDLFYNTANGLLYVWSGGNWKNTPDIPCFDANFPTSGPAASEPLFYFDNSVTPSILHVWSVCDNVYVPLPTSQAPSTALPLSNLADPYQGDWALYCDILAWWDGTSYQINRGTELGSQQVIRDTTLATNSSTPQIYTTTTYTPKQIGSVVRIQSTMRTAHTNGLYQGSSIGWQIHIDGTMVGEQSGNLCNGNNTVPNQFEYITTSLAPLVIDTRIFRAVSGVNDVPFVFGVHEILLIQEISQ